MSNNYSLSFKFPCPGIVRLVEIVKWVDAQSESREVIITSKGVFTLFLKTNNLEDIMAFRLKFDINGIIEYNEIQS